jgi:hypothetical protein
MVQFFTYLTDDRLRWLVLIPQWVQIGDNDFLLSSRIRNRSWIAIPKAVADLPFFHTKGWIVEPHDPLYPVYPSSIYNEDILDVSPASMGYSIWKNRLF